MNERRVTNYSQYQITSQRIRCFGLGCCHPAFLSSRVLFIGWQLEFVLVTRNCVSLLVSVAWAFALRFAASTAGGPDTAPRNDSPGIAFASRCFFAAGRFLVEHMINKQNVFAFCCRFVQFSLIQTQAEEAGLTFAPRRVQIPDSIRRGPLLDWLDRIRPTKGGVNWEAIHTAFRASSVEDLLKTSDDTDRHPRVNLLQMLAQFNTGPVFHDQVTTEIRCYNEVATETIQLYKEHEALDFRGGHFDDTAVAKACATGNERMIRWLVEAGASASLPWLF